MSGMNGHPRGTKLKAGDLLPGFWVTLPSDQPGGTWSRIERLTLPDGPVELSTRSPDGPITTMITLVEAVEYRERWRVMWEGDDD